MPLSFIKFHFSKLTFAILALLIFLFVYPNDLSLYGIPIVNNFIKTRVISLSIVFLVLRGIIHDYYSSKLAIVFLIMLILSPTIPFGYLLLMTLGVLILLKILKAL